MLDYLFDFISVGRGDQPSFMLMNLSVSFFYSIVFFSTGGCGRGGEACRWPHNGGQPVSSGGGGGGWRGVGGGERAPPATSELQAAPKHAMALLAAARDTNMSPFAVLPCHR